MGTILRIDLTGAVPVAKGSMRAFVVNGRAAITDSKTPELRAFERDVRDIAGRELDRRDLGCAHEQPFELLIVYYLPRPGGDFDRHGGVRGAARLEPWTKPDLDKLVRATCDALTGIVWDDDARLCRIVAEKRYASGTRDIGLWLECRVRPPTMRERADEQQQTIKGA